MNTKFTARARLPGEATAPGSSLLDRETYDPAKHGERRQHTRDGANNHIQHKSLSGVGHAVYPRGHK